MLPKTLIFLSTLVVIASSACFDNGDKEIGGSCFKFVTQKLSYGDAKNWCHYQNPVTSSYLAYVPNSGVSNFLASYARSAFGTNDGNFWIGLSRQNGGSWKWDSGQPVVYTNFGGQNGLNYVSESIVNGKWSTLGDSDKNYFVCSYDPAAPPTFAPLSPTPSVATPTTVPTTSAFPTTTDVGCNIRGHDNTFLFAYSTDSDPSDAEVAAYQAGFPPGYSIFVTKRFDLKHDEDFQYTTNSSDFYESFLSHPPNSSYGYQTSAVGSDVFKMIQRFLNNNQSTICGSTLLVLVKRYPNNVDVTSLINELQKNHVTVNFFVHSEPSGGTETQSLMEMAEKTNGVCVFAGGYPAYYDLCGDVNFGSLAYQLFAQNYLVSGVGRIEIPSIKYPISNFYTSLITVQDHALNSNFVSVNFTVFKPDGKVFHTSPTDPVKRYGTVFADYLYFIAGVEYKMVIDYVYANNQEQAIEVRWNSDFWLDFIPNN